jgi:predicted nucleic acid-binding protein
MGERFNIYCDESCHLENDRIPVMVLGSVWCPEKRAKEISERIREIKQKHSLLSPDDLRRPKSHQFEIKWTKVSPAKVQFYLDVVDYFFDDDDMHFRGIVIDKTVLDHAARRQSHDDWYYKMLFRLLEPVIDPEYQYRIYLDIKDTRSEQKRAKLEAFLRTASHDYDSHIVASVQQIRSHESEILQVADLLIGAIAYHHRQRHGDLLSRPGALSQSKLHVIRRIQQRSRKSLERNTFLRESKFNLLCWQPREALQ